MWRQWENDNLDWKQALEEANQQLAEEKNARQGEARARVHYRNMNEKLEKQLDNYKSVLSTLQEQDALTENPSARIAEDPRSQETEVNGEDENEVDGLRGSAVDPFFLGPETVVYSAQDMHELEQEWQEMHQQELIDIQ